MKENQEKSQKIRNFAMIVYDDSASKNWKEKLDNMHIPCFVVYHDRDLNPDKTPKKPHYHLFFTFSGPIKAEEIKCIVGEIGAANGEYRKISSLRSYARYLCHLDNPDKFQYPLDSVENYGGVNYLDLIGSAADKVAIVASIIDFCKEQQIHSYARLIDYCLANRRDWFNILCASGYGRMVRDYIKSNYWTMRNSL